MNKERFCPIRKEIKNREKKAEITAKFDDATLSPEKIVGVSKELDGIVKLTW
ncbi:MAG: hypothetical protein IPG48_13270 [Saprospiraceae bacterium]|nr:hypothetical protein [Saprospiraceae bacterium]